MDFLERGKGWIKELLSLSNFFSSAPSEGAWVRQWMASLRLSEGDLSLKNPPPSPLDGNGLPPFGLSEWVSWFSLCECMHASAIESTLWCLTHGRSRGIVGVVWMTVSSKKRWEGLEAISYELGGGREAWLEESKGVRKKEFGAQMTHKPHIVKMDKREQKIALRRKGSKRVEGGQLRAFFLHSPTTQYNLEGSMSSIVYLVLLPFCFSIYLFIPEVLSLRGGWPTWTNDNQLTAPIHASEKHKPFVFGTFPWRGKKEKRKVPWITSSQARDDLKSVFGRVWQWKGERYEDNFKCQRKYETPPKA